MYIIDIHIAYPDSSLFGVIWIIAGSIFALGIILEIVFSILGWEPGGSCATIGLIVGIGFVGALGSMVHYITIRQEADALVLQQLESDYKWQNIELGSDKFTAESSNGDYLSGDYFLQDRDTYTFVVR